MKAFSASVQLRPRLSNQLRFLLPENRVLR
jgi:hypothetical protein